MALLAFGLSFFGTLTVTDEVQNYFHLFSEAQRSDFNGLILAMRWTLLRINRNLERHLETRGEVIRSLKLLRRCLKVLLFQYKLVMCFSLFFVLK